MTASVTQHFTNAIIRQLGAQNIVLPPDLLNSLHAHAGQERLPMRLQDELWHTLAQQAHTGLGLHLGLEMRPENFDTMGFLLLTCPSLSVAVDCLINYSVLVGDGGTFSHSHCSAGWELCYQPRFSSAVALRIETIFSCVATGASWVAGKNITPVKVRFAHPQGAPSRLYAKVFGNADITFGQSQNAIVYADEDWHFKQREVNPALQAQMLALANQQLAALKSHGFSDRADTLMRHQPWLSRSQLAASLAVSERTLTRKLAKAGTSYQQLRDTVRQAHALSQVCSSHVTQASLASYFGYCDESAFAKAFRRWTGMGFRAYQQQHCRFPPRS